MLGQDPRTERDALMEEVCFIADVAVLPRWIKVSQAVEFVAGVHPRFDRKRAEEFLAKTDIKHRPAACASSPRAWSRSCTWR